jgi:hypothetical protein
LESAGTQQYDGFSKRENQGAVVSFLLKIKKLITCYVTVATSFATIVVFTLPGVVLAQDGSAGAMLEDAKRVPLNRCRMCR